jgi:DNA-binding MarR family transcriptional regulator
MVNCLGIAHNIMRHNVALTKFLEPLYSIKDISWQILLQIYASNQSEGLSLSMLVDKLKMEPRALRRYLFALSDAGYIVDASENAGCFGLVNSTRNAMDEIFQDMA